MNILEIIVVAALCYGAYRLGHSDGEMAEREAENFKKLDRIIESLRQGK